MIDTADMERLKEVFVTRQECDVITDNLNKDIAKHDTNLALMKQDLDLIKKIDWFILGLVLTAIVGALMKLILKL